MTFVLDRREMLAGGALAMGALPAPGAAAALEPWRSLIDEVGSTAVHSGSTAGLAIALTTGGRTTARGYGIANLETGTPVTASSVFRIASITKTFTAAAIVLLTERGRLRLDQPLSDFYPAIEGARAITVRQLLSHTSGLHDYVRGGLPADIGRDWTTADEFAAGVARMDPRQDFAPGTRFSYSNSGYILLGGIIEKASVQSYEKFLADALFAPCGMTRTAVDHDADIAFGRAEGYSLVEGHAGGFRHAAGGKLPFAAGAIRSTVEDLSRWTSAFMDGRVVSAANVKAMTSPARVADGRTTGSARWWPPGFDPGKPPAFARDDDYGLGWETTTFYGQRTVGHNGGISGYNSIVARYLDRDLTLVLLANTDNGIIKPAFELMRRMPRSARDLPA